VSTCSQICIEDDAVAAMETLCGGERGGHALGHLQSPYHSNGCG
jgi:hypothetical protein